MTSKLLCLAFALWLPLAWAQQPAKPNFSGVWLLNRRNIAQNPDTQWTKEKLPFTSKGLEVLKANKPGAGPRSAPPDVENDPMRGANPPGLMRSLLYARPFEFEQLPSKVIQMFTFGRIWRSIYTDGRPVPDDIPAGPFWYGYTVGKWEGDTLVATTLALDERAWMDSWGTPIGPDTRIEERWQRVGDTLQLKVTVNDSITYSKPWTSSPLTYRQVGSADPEEIIHAPVDEAAFNERLRKPALTPAK